VRWRQASDEGLVASVATLSRLLQRELFEGKRSFNALGRAHLVSAIVQSDTRVAFDIHNFDVCRISYVSII